jgi:hypothetical protein
MQRCNEDTVEKGSDEDIYTSLLWAQMNSCGHKFLCHIFCFVVYLATALLNCFGMIFMPKPDYLTREEVHAKPRIYGNSHHFLVKSHSLHNLVN